MSKKLRYFTNFTEAQAQEWSRLAYRISRPERIAGAETTRYVFAWTKHPEREEYYIGINGDELPVNEFTKSEILAGELVEEFSKVYTNPVELEEKAQLILASDRVKMIDLLPVEIFVYEKTYQELNEEGWFPSAVV